MIFIKWKRQTKLKVVITLTTVMFFGEIIFGYMTNSIALIADSFHMLSDIIALCIAHYAITLSTRKTTNENYTFGWQRAETLGALVNAVFLLSLCFTIFVSAIQRLFVPIDITNPMIVLVVGCIGLGVNIIGLVLFHDVGHGHDHNHIVEHVHAHSHINTDVESVRSQTNDVAIDTTRPNDAHGAADSHHGHEHGSLNMHGAFLHVLGDALGSIGVIISASIIQWVTSWQQRYLMDPIVSLFIVTIIFITTWRLFRKTSAIILHIVPPSISIAAMRETIRKFPFVNDLHEFHVWQLSDRKTVASIHVVLDKDINRDAITGKQYMEYNRQIKDIMHKNGIHNTTIQFETVHHEPLDLSEIHCDEDNYFSLLQDNPWGNASGASIGQIPYGPRNSTLANQQQSLVQPVNPTSSTCLISCTDDVCRTDACCPL